MKSIKSVSSVFSSRNMCRLYCWTILLAIGISAQDNPLRIITPSLLECYDNKYLLEKDNRLPHTLNTLIAIIQKIENMPDFNMDLRSLTVAILHKFRQDGMVKNPTIAAQPGVSPYVSDIDQFAKLFQILRFIPERDNKLIYDNLSDIERCTLHFMLSSSIELDERGDEGTVCRVADNIYRNARNINTNFSANTNLDDVETLTPEQLDNIIKRKDKVTENAIDPNVYYPALPPNHPKIARVTSLPISRCPVENGVIRTNWGAVSIGALIAGIAAGLQPEKVKLSEVLLDQVREKPYLSEIILDNKWIATLAGDLAEVTLIQGPTNEISVGVNGNWNSSTIPCWYFLNANKKLEFTAAEVRGDLDGLILANEIESLFSKIPNLKLSQILDMYYSPRGLFNSSLRACNRRTLFTEIAPNSTMSSQAYSAALVLKEYLQKATISDNTVKNFAVQATNELSNYISSSMNKELSCRDTETGNFNDVVQFSVDLTIILDTSWPFNTIQSVLATLLDNMKINQYNGQFTLINGRDGNIMMNTTSSILDFGSYNITNYRNVTASGFDLAKSFKELSSLQTKKLNDERSSLGNAKSDVVLIIPYTSSVPDNDKNYCLQEIRKMREQVPDATLLILTYGSKERWSDFVNNPSTDLFSINLQSDMRATLPIIFNLISRIKQVPQRLINTQCGSNYSPVGSSNSFIDYIEPATVTYYRMHPNYFFSSDTSHTSKIKIEGSGWGNLKVCTSRRFVNVNSIENENQCTSITNNMHTISFSCNEAGLIHLCQPLYLSIIANSSVTSYQCTEPRVCRFPHMIKYTISYENLVCTSSANINLLNTIILIISMVYIFS